MALDIDFVRGQFPAFAEPTLQGQAFFENAGGSYTCKPVIDRLMRYYTQRKVQPYAPYEASTLAGAEMDEARQRLAAILGVDTDEVSFGPSTTQNTYVLAQAFRQFLSPGEAIIVTNQDHEANTGPWRRLAEEGIEVREWKIDPATGHLDPADLETLLDENVRLVCFPHCSNVVGEINPVTEITALCHAAGAFVCVDGVSYAPHGLPNVGELGPDIYLFSAYKTYGPHQGIMVIRRALGEILPNQAHYFNGDVLYKRFTPAGPDHAQVAASAGMADYIDALCDHHGGPTEDAAARAGFVHDLMRDHEVKLLQPLLDALKDRNDLRLIGPSDAAVRAPTVAVAVNRSGAGLAEELAGHGIMAGGGDFYAVRALSAMGVDPEQGVLRMSFTHYTNENEVTQLIEALDRVL
ncbi:MULTISPECIES: aminotransferase class V-fold PLP-dependent enzyme [Rhodobacterales]|jgi:cysteine desulfurase family protein (TIGR01976 family)|uniref:aminotransferase class V-fold PLP-dependent enzyme n=1 Tax=Rhodobacterales TaxID=204455 RepID=UPI00237F8A23|nr:aminotransferase class V-fold PLP-dependent enzyme [Phaeobacter gallaeciensis]MDE4096269.1 aminotransferase class V-fold PLP-dependent enzyme [Phaeobacter gallaeciensis]MDE4105080.1 aminotransferase class V-fold PLP-dependent enzyme [Phaeobacter gallaeciensis]MDE4109536.1 aminotransferase class V-fold PLP-dependent enzyme [Phaeobacter gallaeciensis]MDE4114004.1 aminotransferase class V-fold PLP-dependent enzyme [Phaeobacter gallaeciensis]MDE4118471.1 aminotransferase class V-fold PLP-depend